MLNHEVENEEYQETKKDSKIDVQANREVEQVETPQPESFADQQYINKDQEEKHGHMKLKKNPMSKY
ncbi:hypothetical protein SESBI_20236 [Sesbania bispinosa]|nr:hypothetical protein SESBI_20236 [Sesbania bispinosa]